MTVFLVRSLAISGLAVLLTLLCVGQTSQTFHAHLNKDMYLPGETIWFNAYVFEKSLPAEKSTTIFAGLYNADGKLIQSKRFPLFNGVAAGSFDIPDSISSGQLYLNLFTGNIPEQNRSKAYNKMIAIYQQDNDSFFQNDHTKENISVEVIPEAGHLISGLPNHLILKAKYETGQPVSMAFTIKKMSGELIDSINSNSAGLAGLQITPKQGERYILSWADRNGKTNELILPEAEMSGAILHTEIANNQLFYSIHKNTEPGELQELKLFLLNGDDVLFSQQINFKTASQYVGNVSIDSFPNGISSLQLKDKNDHILQQKYIYIKGVIMRPQVVIKNKSAEKKGKNVIEVSVPGTGITYLSAAVMEASFYIPELQSSIVDELLLNRHQSGMLFYETNTKFADYFVNAYPPLIQPDNSLIDEDFLSVSVINNSNIIPANAELDLIVSDKGHGKQFFKIKQTKPGIFSARGLLFYDSARLYYQVSGNQSLSAALSLQQDPLPSSLPYIQPEKKFPVQFSDSAVKNRKISISDYLGRKTDQFNEAQVIESVRVLSRYQNPVTKRLMQLDDEYTTGMFKGMARGTQLNVLDDPYAQFSDPYNYILYRTGSVAVEGSMGSRIIVSTRPIEGKTPLMLFIDENPAEFIQLESIQMSRVAYIKIILGVVTTASGVTNSGVIYLYTKKGNEDKVSSMKSTILKGYDLVADYKLPEYGTETMLRNADFRTSLYWNPNITTDQNNRSFTIEYYNNDIGKKQVLIIKGINEYGQLIEFKKILE